MPKRQATIETELLRLLKEGNGYQFREEDLFRQLRIRVAHLGIAAPSTQEMTDALQSLDTALQVVGVHEDGVIRWDITARGKSRQAKELM